MLIDSLNFDELIFPITPGDFFKNYWEKKPLILSNRKVDGYKNLISLKELDALISSLPPPREGFPSISLSNNKKQHRFHIEDYLNRRGEILSRNKVLTGFSEGQTITLYRMHRFCDPIRKVCQKLEKQFGHVIGADLFLSPKDAQGFHAHYDPHDVFILQVEGKKRWKIYGQHVKYPLVEEGVFPLPGTCEKPLHEVVLSPGDFLYIPRGCVHEVATDNQHSLHLAITLDVFTWADLLKELIQGEPEMRKALPVGLLHESSMKKIDLKQGHRLTKMLTNGKEVDRAFKRLKVKFLKMQKHPRNESYMDRIALSEISMEGQFQKREELECVVLKNDNQATLCFEDDEIVGPLYIEPVLQHIVKAKQFSIRSLPNVLTKSGKITLLRRLIQVGVVVPTNQKGK